MILRATTIFIALGAAVGAAGICRHFSSSFFVVFFILFFNFADHNLLHRYHITGLCSSSSSYSSLATFHHSRYRNYYCRVFQRKRQENQQYPKQEQPQHSSTSQNTKMTLDCTRRQIEDDFNSCDSSSPLSSSEVVPVVTAEDEAANAKKNVSNEKGRKGMDANNDDDNESKMVSDGTDDGDHKLMTEDHCHQLRRHWTLQSEDCKSSSPPLSTESSPYSWLSESNNSNDREKRFILDLNLSTKQNYGVTHKEFYGPYRHIRASLDYQYHGNYIKSRQELQDRIIHKLLDGTTIHDITNGRVCKTPTEPWIVFTAGVMGAGKSHTMKQLASQGLFPLKSYVLVDPDEIRSNFPEYHLYAKECPKVAGELTHTEAGYVTEIITAAALQQGHNVLVDGSLRDYAWYREYFKSLRDEYGNSLRIAILHITAPREVVFERAANRAKNTGRVVPTETLITSLEQVPISVQKLAPLADFFCELDNSQCTSSGGEVVIKTPGVTWDTFRDNWVQTCPWAPAEGGNKQLMGKM